MTEHEKLHAIIHDDMIAMCKSFREAGWEGAAVYVEEYARQLGTCEHDDSCELRKALDAAVGGAK